MSKMETRLTTAHYEIELMLPEAMIRKLKDIAAYHNTSIDRVVRELLAPPVEKEFDNVQPF
jgi:hypothetical protein